MGKGILYGVGVGPGDPELLTLKAVRIMETCDVIVVPRSGGSEEYALNIAKDYTWRKRVLRCDMPMTREKNICDEHHERAADQICGLLDEGKMVAFLTIGDPSIYSTYWYVHKKVVARGYDAKIIPGVPSFCAAAAAAGRALCKDNEILHIIPASYSDRYTKVSLPGAKVLMKAGRGFMNVRERLRNLGVLKKSVLVERCGMDGERVEEDLDKIDSPCGYFSIILVQSEEE